MDREWLKYIDLNIMDIYPIQFANCDRLVSNDSVYIFDEVGSGKTISSGLMAIDYLYNSKDKDVLIITTNALSKKGQNSNYGQFLKDWYEKLPFQILGLESKVKVTNNHYSHFQNNAKYGLVIIDEAQLFLNTESLRFQLLTQNISAEKVIFLTATPIKNSKYDLQVYVQIARKITGKNDIPDDWIEEINSVGKKKEQILCNKFEEKYPVTRYFKDTIMSLNVDGFVKNKARRLLPELWKYGKGITKDQILLDNININCYKDKRNKFIVFTRFVEKEAKKIGNYLESNGFIKHTDGTINSKTYAVITGENAYELCKYSGTNNLPTVLILTYQIAEQGVNLPGYNYVINYHISSFPSALEQRFGRIDRMGKNGSVFSEIIMCFLILDDYWDTNTCNFYCAVSIYLNNLISYLPSKNTILSEEILDQYNQAQGLVTSYIEKISNLLKQDQQIRAIKDYFEHLNSIEMETENIQCSCDKELFEFIDENSIEFNLAIDEEESSKKFREDVKTALLELKSNIGFRKGFSVEQYKLILETISDKIFYLTSDISNGVWDSNLQTLDAIECGKTISNKENFNNYRITFQDKVKLPIIVNNYFKIFNEYFEELFIRNDFNNLFPFSGYGQLFQSIFKKEEFNNLNYEDKNLILDNCEKIVSVLPIFKMCYEFKKIIQSLVFTQTGDIRIRFDFNPFYSSFVQLGCKIKQDERQMGLSDRFISMYWNNDICIKNLFALLNENNVVQATNWYKLSYHYTRKEEAAFIFDNTEYKWTLTDNFKKNPFYRKEEHLRFISEVYVDCNKEADKFYRARYEYKMAIEDATEFTELPHKYQSMFHHFIFTDGDNYRTHSDCTPLVNYYSKPRAYSNDIWTQGIYYELYKVTFKDCIWGNLLELPQECSQFSLFG